MLPLKDLVSIFYPQLCVVCKNQLMLTEEVLCTFCRHDLPIISMTDFEKNNISAIFYGKIPIQKAASFLFFRKEGKAKKIIHELKYKGNEKIGTFIGNWFGKTLKKSNSFDPIDHIIPVPLHPKKLRKRGYNQLDKFGEQLSLLLQKPYTKNVLIKISTTKTQTFKSRLERFNKMNSEFLLSDHAIFKNKHVLLIDDVITTGATLEACCTALFKTENIKISIATIAFTD